MTDISGRVALVTGGGSGIGKALATALAAEGAAVVVADIRPGSASSVAEEITAAGGRAVALGCDVCERDSIRQLKREAHAAFGPVTLLVANAGATSFERLTGMADADVDWIIQVNLMGVTYTIQEFLPDMIAAGQGGHILTTASMAGLLPAWIPLHAPYSAAKMGIIGLTLNLGLELAEHGIGVTTYCPGGVATGMKDNNGRYRPQRFGGPGPGPVSVPDGFFLKEKTTFLPPEQIAPMVLRAIRNNRAIVVDHAEQRKLFVETYQKFVMQAFDDVEEYEKSLGGNAHQ
jgi:NAD(P)-dependent dehydrogenase (short-subunit alcohol dehydrogenase family)